MEAYAPYRRTMAIPDVWWQYAGDNPKAMAPMIRDAFKAADPNQPYFHIRTMDDRLIRRFLPTAVTMILLGVFASIRVGFRICVFAESPNTTSRRR